jgi:hypothetical protein
MMARAVATIHSLARDAAKPHQSRSNQEGAWKKVILAFGNGEGTVSETGYTSALAAATRPGLLVIRFGDLTWIRRGRHCVRRTGAATMAVARRTSR